MKKLKVYWNGEHLRDIYPHATRWQVIKYRVGIATMKGLKVGMLASIFCAMLYGSFTAGTKNATNTLHAVSVDSMPAKIEKLKDAVIDKLVSCESAGLKESDAPIVYDSNKKMSIGVLQFQVSTVIHYEKMLNKRVITPKEAVMIALNADEAKELAKQVIFETKNGVSKDWVNCSKKHGLQAEVDLIKKLAK